MAIDESIRHWLQIMAYTGSKERIRQRMIIKDLKAKQYKAFKSQRIVIITF